MIFEILFWISIFSLFHSYIFFPFLLRVLSMRTKQNQIVFFQHEELPGVSVLLAVYNEESVIEEKIIRTFKSNYPLNKIEFIIGSDASTDKTNSIIKNFITKFPQLNLVEFSGRTGKAGIINHLETLASNKILILTDANVFFEPDTIYQLVKHYKNPEIAIVGGNIINCGLKQDGISYQETSYLKRENLIKYQEGAIWGNMIGSFGGCYSILKDFYSPVPKNFFMDDFYITLGVLEKGKKSICELDAICHEDVSNKVTEEFRRKVRISIGNFQNLNRYKKLLFPPFSGLAFSFFSHKVLRWFGPLLILVAFIFSAVLAQTSNFYFLLFSGQLVLMSLPVIDFILKKINIHIRILRFITHFYLMNLALLVGLFKYIKGVNSNVWKPTERNQ